MHKFLVFGDSNVNRLKSFLFEPIFHLESFAGLTTESVINTMIWELEVLVSEDQYDAVVIILGMNDLLLKDTTAENLATINDLVSKYSPRCYFVNLIPLPKFALKTIPVNIITERHFESDGIHLNKRGAQLLAVNMMWNLFSDQDNCVGAGVK